MSYLAAFLTRSLCGAATDLSRSRRLLVFSAIAFVSAGAEAALGVSLDPMSDQGGVPLQNWFQWTLCDALGLALGTPAILFAIKSGQARPVGNASAPERWLLVAGTLALCLIGFSWARSPVFLLLYPALILTAFRAGPAWVLASVLLTCIAASSMTAHGFGPLALLAAHGHDMREDMMQPYLVSLFLAAMPANNGLGEKTRTALRLGRLKTAREHEATHDTLTTLANRDLFRRSLTAMLHAGSVRAVLFVDLDRFKQVNDTLGHQAGDELLRSFGARLSACMGPGFMVARFGGDEFAVLVPSHVAEADIAPLCGAIKATAGHPFDLPQGQAHVSASLGVAVVSDDTRQAGELMRRADISLLRRQGGRTGLRAHLQRGSGPASAGAGGAGGRSACRAERRGRASRTLPGEG